MLCGSSGAVCALAVRTYCCKVPSTGLSTSYLLLDVLHYQTGFSCYFGGISNAAR